MYLYAFFTIAVVHTGLYWRAAFQVLSVESKYTAEVSLQTIGKARDLPVGFGKLSFGYTVYIHVLNTAYI